jgi:hypothetical protein
MTTVTVTIAGNDMTSSVEGKGGAELQKCVDKMQDGLQWTLLIKSKATLIKTENPGENWFNAHQGVHLTAFGASARARIADMLEPAIRESGNNEQSYILGSRAAWARCFESA